MIVATMLENEEKWNRIGGIIETIMRLKEEDERTWQKGRNAANA
jgi:hypothetical protein